MLMTLNQTFFACHFQFSPNSRLRAFSHQVKSGLSPQTLIRSSSYLWLHFSFLASVGLLKSVHQPHVAKKKPKKETVIKMSQSAFEQEVQYLLVGLEVCLLVLHNLQRNMDLFEPPFISTLVLSPSQHQFRSKGSFHIFKIFPQISNISIIQIIDFVLQLQSLLKCSEVSTKNGLFNGGIKPISRQSLSKDGHPKKYLRFLNQQDPENSVKYHHRIALKYLLRPFSPLRSPAERGVAPYFSTPHQKRSFRLLINNQSFIKVWSNRVKLDLLKHLGMLVEQINQVYKYPPTSFFSIYNNLIEIMSKAEAIKQFIKKRIAEIDSSLLPDDDLLSKLKSSSMRTSFANILNVYLNEEEELGVSYYKHALTYQSGGCYEQAIHYAQLSRKNLRDPQLLEKTAIVYMQCLISLNRIEEANDALNLFKPNRNKKNYFQIRTEIMERLRKEQECFESLNNLEDIIKQQYSQVSIQMGLYYIERGRKKGSFQHFEESLELMHQGINTLIEAKYKDHQTIGDIYLTMAHFCKSLSDDQGEYTALICAHSMIRQGQNKEKDLIGIMHRIVDNLVRRKQFEEAAKQLLKIQILEKHIYGQSSVTVAKTIKQISELMSKLNRRIQSRKYEQQYSRIINCNDRRGMSREKPLKYSQVKGQN